MGGTLLSLESPRVHSLLTWDPDGEGPSPAQLYAAGNFTSAGGVAASGIARWDGTAWNALGSGVNFPVNSLTLWDPDGNGPGGEELIAGGQFDVAGGTTAKHVARWNGAAWLPVGPGVIGEVSALTSWDFDADGPLAPQLVVGGGFITLGGGNFTNLARWDGVAWLPLGSEVDSVVRALVTWDPDGPGAQPSQLVIAGEFVNTGGVISNGVARWAPGNANWQAFGNGLGGKNPYAFALTTWDPDATGPATAQVVIGGAFESAGGVTTNGIARWNGSTWQPFGSGFDVAENVSRVRSAASWDPDGDGPHGVRLVTAGTFSTAGGTPAGSIAQWIPEASEWQAFGDGINERVYALATWDPDGTGPLTKQLVAAGSFTRAGNVGANGIARWDGVAWHPIGSGMNGSVFALTTWDPDDLGPAPAQLVAAGDFSTADASPANCVVRWNPDVPGWQRFPFDVWENIYAATTWDPDGSGPILPQLLLGGEPSEIRSLLPTVAWWDGKNWNGDGGPNGNVYALTTWDPDGPGPQYSAMVAGGEFIHTSDTLSVNYIAWNNLNGWNGFGSGMSGGDARVFALTTWDPDGAGPLSEQIIAGGGFTHAGGTLVNRIARWSGSAWQPLGAGMDDQVRALASWDPDGGGPLPSVLLAAGWFSTAGGIAANRIAQWDGSSWQALGSGLTSGSSSEGNALATWDPDGAGSAQTRVVVGGLFTQAGGHVSAQVAEWGRASALWAGPVSGSYSDAARWFCGIAPSDFDSISVDATQALYTPSSFTITVPDGGGDITCQSLNVTTDIVTLNLRNRPLVLRAQASLATPGLTVGKYSNQPATLVVRNTLGVPTAMEAGSVIIGDVATPTPLLDQLRAQDANARIDLSGDLYVGKKSNKGEFVIQGLADATVEGGISIGTEPSAVGEVRVQNAGSTLFHSTQGRTLAIGEYGHGTWTIGGSGSLGGAVASSIGRMENILIGLQLGSTGTAKISGTNSSWTLLTQNLYVGYAGNGSLRVDKGALLDTDSFGEVVIGRYPGSTGNVTLRDAGSRWIERSQAITVGTTGVLDVGAGTTVEALGLNVLPGGTVTGSGTIGSLTANLITTDIFNFGTITPKDDAGLPSNLTVEGNYRQIGPPPGGGADDSGLLDIVFDPTGTQASSLTVNGQVELGGALVVRFPGGVGPSKGAPAFAAISGASILNQFDVAFFPRFSASPKDDRFMKVVYNNPLENGIGVSLVVDSLSNLLDIGNPNNVSVNGSPNAAALGDLDGDGDLDIAVTVPDPNPSNNGSLFVLTNNGSGSFSVTAQYATGREPSAVAIGPIDGVSGSEIVVANRGDDNVRVYTNSFGVFTPGSIIAAGDEPVDIDPVDLDNDKDLDIVVANFASDNLALAINNGSGGFPLPPGIVGAGDEPVDVDPVDLDNDKDLDIIVSNFGSNTVSTVINDGNGNFPTQSTFPVGDGPFRVEAAFLDNNAIPDIVTTDRTGNTVSVLRATAPLTYAPSVQLPVGAQPRSIVAVDLDGDADLDLAIVANDPVDGPVVQVLRNDSPPGQLALAAATNIPAGADPILVLAGNVDNAGGDDLVTINDSVLLGLTTGADNDVSILLNAVSPPPECAGDTNGDNVVNGADLSVLLGQFGQSVTPGSGADLNNDGFVNGADLSVLLGRFGVAC